MSPNTLIYLFAFFKLTKEQFVRDRKPIVSLPQGVVVGAKVYTDSNRAIDAYLGLPYAAPPVNNLRFAAPQQHKGWNGTYPASQYGPSCPQLPIKPGETEDCLYLNVWTPENAVRIGPFPVLIFFEGIDFAQGNRVSIPCQDLASEGIVVITVNYRLNVFGFLCLGMPELRGNMGLLDQYFAMLWVRDYIKYFGGHPDKITLFGHAAGAVSVTLHMISPRTAGLFQKVIISSGSAVSPWYSSNDPLAASKKIVKILGCFNSYETSILGCLRSKSTEDILKAFEEYIESNSTVDLLLPVTDNFLAENNQYLLQNPSEALRSGTYLQVPILMGTAKFIADLQYGQWRELAGQAFIQLQQFVEQSKIPEIMGHYNFYGQNEEQIFEVIKWKYVTTANGNAGVLLNQLKDLNYEAKIQVPHFTQLNYLTSTYVQPIFVYDLDDADFVLNNTDLTVTSDLLLLFGPLLFNQIGRRRFTASELRLSKHIKQLWTNFIIFGNPTPNNQLKIWRRYTANDGYVEHLGHDERKTDEGTAASSITFWTQLLPKLANFKNKNTNTILKQLQTSPDPAAGFRHAMYILLGLVVALLILLLICIVLLKRRSKNQERHFHMGF